MKRPINALLTLALSITLTPLASAQVSNNDYLVLQKGELIVHKNGKPETLKQKLTLSNGFTVETNGVVTLKGGGEKPLKEGQKLTLDGFLIANDGQFTPFEDHVALRNGVVTIVKDGVATAAAGIVRLADGTQIFPRGSVVRPNGQKSQLLDGQMLKLSGPSIDSSDFAMFQNGQVTLKKDGSIISLSPNKSMMMSDGSKVFGTGLVHRKDGSRIQLGESQRLNFPGAR